MLTRKDLLEYMHEVGKIAAENLLLLIDPDGFDGDYGEMEEEIKALSCKLMPVPDHATQSRSLL